MRGRGPRLDLYGPGLPYIKRLDIIPTFDIALNSDSTISIIATDVDPAVKDGSRFTRSDVAVLRRRESAAVYEQGEPGVNRLLQC